MPHQLPSEFTAGIIDYKQYVNFLLIKYAYCKWGKIHWGKLSHFHDIQKYR